MIDEKTNGKSINDSQNPGIKSKDGMHRNKIQGVRTDWGSQNSEFPRQRSRDALFEMTRHATSGNLSDRQSYLVDRNAGVNPSELVIGIGVGPSVRLPVVESNR